MTSDHQLSPKQGSALVLSSSKPSQMASAAPSNFSFLGCADSAHFPNLPAIQPHERESVRFEARRKADLWGIFLFNKLPGLHQPREHTSRSIMTKGAASAQSSSSAFRMPSRSSSLEEVLGSLFLLSQTLFICPSVPASLADCRSQFKRKERRLS